ncbi:MAG: FHA domain-containing protein [Candidatus Latescibacterota bacterium]|nr:MAG: FHA domain-containing protein [Candidatus Latescibacterota bacterium]
MDKLIVDNREIDVEKQLSDYQELAGKRDSLRDRLRRADAEKGSVASHIFDKVHAEYQKELENMIKEIGPLEDDVSKTRMAVADQIKRIQDQTTRLQDQIDELGFRHRVGEFDGNTHKEKETPLKEELAELATQIRDLSGMLSRLALTDQEPVEPATDQISEESREESPVTDQQRPISSDHDSIPGASTIPVDDHESDVPAPHDSGAKNEDEYGLEPTPTSRPATTAPNRAEPEIKPVPPNETTPTVSDDDQEFVDPSEWVGEFAREVDGKAGKDTPDETSKSTDVLDDRDKSGAQSDLDCDPLAHLADPSDEAIEDPVDKIADDASDASKTHETDAGEGFPILTITKGAGTGRRLPLLPMTMTLGREHDNNIELKDTDVARYHARISFERGEYVIEDLEGSPGTWVNENKITKTVLSPGDTIKAGSTELTIEFE